MRWLSALLVFALGVETAARAWPVHDSNYFNPGLRFFWPDGLARANSLGLTDREPGPKRGPRILLIGDSICEGAGVGWRRRFSALLNEALAERTVGADVCNAGICGLDTLEESHVLQRVGDAVQPDIVVVGYCLNDAEGPYAPWRRGPSAVERLLRGPLQSYALYRAWALAQKWRNSAVDYVETVGQQHGDETLGWCRVCQGLDGISAWCDRRRVRKLLVVFPLFAPEAGAARGTMDKVVGAARQRGFEARSLLDDFDGQWERYVLSAFDGHPNAAGHERLAMAVADMVGVPQLSYMRAVPR